MRQQVGDKTVTGYVVTTPKTVETPRGQMVAFRLAEPQQAFNKETRQYEDLAPRYYDVAVGREQLGKNVLASVEVGQRVSVTGNHSMEAYVARDGKAGLGNRLWAEEVAASMQHNTVQVAPGVGQAGADVVRQRAQLSQASQQNPEGWGPKATAADLEQKAGRISLVERPGVQAGGPGREAGLERQSPEQIAKDPGWQASNQPVEQHFGVERGGPALSGPSR